MTGPVTARRVALDVLVEVDRGARANVALAARLAGTRLEDRDRGFATELVYGTQRMRRACDWLIDGFVRPAAGGKPRRPLDADVRAALRAGAYQLAFLHTPAHAAVSATAAEVPGPGRGLVNAVLRRIAEQAAAGPIRWPDEATALSYPDWIIDRLTADLGPADGRGALEQMNRPAQVRRRADGYIQDLASELVADHIGAEPGQRVLDVCAAPGGKATALAGTGAWVVAADIDPARASVVAATARGLDLGELAVMVADGRRPPLVPRSFDSVLVDAPCSGLGVLRRRPDARWRVRAGDVERLAALQRQLLTAALALVAPGGRLVYSVCTLTRPETAGVDRWLAARYPDWRPLPPPGAPWQPAGRGALLLPQTAGTDGMFLLALRAPPGQ